MTEGRVPWSRNVTEGRVPWSRNVIEGRVPWSRNVTEGHVPWSRNVTEGRVPWSRNVIEGHVPWSRNVIEGRVLKNSGFPIRKVSNIFHVEKSSTPPALRYIPLTSTLSDIIIKMFQKPIKYMGVATKIFLLAHLSFQENT